jgi:hypothetical protein
MPPLGLQAGDLVLQRADALVERAGAGAAPQLARCWRTASSPMRIPLAALTCRLAASSAAGRQSNVAWRAPGATRSTRSTVALPG